MDNLGKLKSEKIELLLNEAIQMFKEDFGENPFKDLEKCIKIVKQRNYLQYPLVKKEVSTIILMIFGDRFENVANIVKILDEVYSIIDNS